MLDILTNNKDLEHKIFAFLRDVAIATKFEISLPWRNFSKITTSTINKKATTGRSHGTVNSWADQKVLNDNLEVRIF